MPDDTSPSPDRASTASAYRSTWGRITPGNLYKAIGLAFLLALLLRYLDPVVHVLLLTYAAAILAVIFNAIIQLFPTGRKWIAATIGVVILASIAAVLWFGIPILFAQLHSLVAQVGQVSSILANVQSWIQENTGLHIPLVSEHAQQLLRNTFFGGSSGPDLLAKAQGLLGILLIPLVILFGALYAAGKPNDQLLSPLMRTVPRERRESFRRILELLGDRILGWARGVLMGMLAVGVLSYVGYMIAGVPNALVLAVIAALTEAIPLLGPWIGGAIATAAGFVHDPTTGLYAALVAVAVQQLENNLIVPWAMSESAEVHPFVTLFALVLFGSLWGFLGVVLSIPLVLFFATVVQVLWVERAIDTEDDTIQPVVEE